MRADIDAAVRAGTVLGGRYLLREDLGSGGSAVVHAAEDRKLTRRVAVKTLRTGLCADPAVVQAFLREARVAANLNHPGVVAVHDVGEDVVEGTRVPWMVLEYVEGPTVRELLANGPMPTVQALSLLADVLDALQHSHEHGVVHRDISPGNVMVTWQQQVKVTDFGIAAAVGDRTGTDLRGTGSTVRGTAAFLSPEQAQGRPVDGRSDLYSAGCLLFALLTGRPPFVGADAADVVWQHVNQEPLAPSHVRPGIPGSVDRLVLAALAKSPDRRFPDARVMRSTVLSARDGLESGRAVTPLAESFAPAQNDVLAVEAAAPAVEAVAPVANAAPADNLSPAANAVPAANAAQEDNADDVTVIRRPTPFHRYDLDEGAAYPAGHWSADSPPTSLRSLVESATSWLRSIARGEVDHRAGIVALFVGACLALGGVVWWVTAAAHDEPVADAAVGDVVVPSLAGRTVDNATDRLVAVGLRTGRTKLAASDSVAVGRVIRTEPAAGERISRRGRVDLVVSRGTSHARVPDLQGHTLAEARRILLAHGLRLRSVVDRDSPYPSGNVLESAPAAGSDVPAGAEVSLVIGSGWSRVPDVRGLHVGDARKLLVAAGFKAGPLTVVQAAESSGTTTSPDSEATPGPASGTVEQTQPAVARRARVGATVAIEVVGTESAGGEPVPEPSPGPTAPTPTKPQPRPSPTPSRTSASPSPTPTHPSPTPTQTPTPTPTPTPGKQP